MSRLTEALERARANSSEGPTRLIPKSSESARPGAPRSAWKFDEETAEEAAERRSSVEVPHTWQIDVAEPGRAVDAPVEQEKAPVARAAVKTTTADEPAPPPAGPHYVAPDLERMDIQSADFDKLVVARSADPNVVEQYRAVAAAVHHAQLETGARALMVSSAVESEGKTLTSTNLALTLSHSYQRRVLLVDADLRRPSIHQRLRLDNRRGLSDTLKDDVRHGVLPVQRVLPTLWVMTAGRPNPDPMGLLVSETMRAFLVDAVDQFDWIVIDTPPVALLSDANLLAAMVDLAILVVNAGTTPHALVTRAIEAIGRTRILGVVLNRAVPETPLGYEHFYSYTGAARGRRKFGFMFRRAPRFAGDE